jgi:homoserine dehydrogenase
MEGITSITTADIQAADELGFRIKLLGVAQRTDTGIEQRVHPTMVPKSSAIARIDGVLNAVAVDGDFVGEIVLVGPGAGGNATASSVVADIADIARGDETPVLGMPATGPEPYIQAGPHAPARRRLLHAPVGLRPAGRVRGNRPQSMGDAGISLESIVQRGTRVKKMATAKIRMPRKVCLSLSY